MINLNKKQYEFKGERIDERDNDSFTNIQKNINSKKDVSFLHVKRVNWSNSNQTEKSKSGRSKRRPTTTSRNKRFKKLDITKDKLCEAKIDEAEFWQIEFWNKRIPDLTYLFVYLVFGDLILEYFIRYVLSLKDLKMYFTLSDKQGLWMKYDIE